MGMRDREQDVLRACLDLLALHRIPAWRNNAGMVATAKGHRVRLGPAGAADIIGCLPPSGRLIAVECKRKSGRVRPAQEAWLAAMCEAGALCVVVRSVTDLEQVLREEGASR